MSISTVNYRGFFPETGPHQNLQHSHLRWPTPNAIQTEKKISLRPLQPRRRHSQASRIFIERHKVCHTATCSGHMSRAPWYSTNIQQCNTCRLVRTNKSVQALIQQVIKAVDKQYMISTKNCITGKFTGNIRQIVAYLLSTYGKISPSHLNNFKK